MAGLLSKIFHRGSDDASDERIDNHRPPRIGLALGAGGARGLSHIGVIQVLEEEGLTISAISGASMGAYIGALYAFGCDGRQLEAIAARQTSKKDVFKLLDPIIPPTSGFVRGELVRDALAYELRNADFEDLQMPLSVIAADRDTGEQMIFTSGPVAPAVHASCAIPGVCHPVTLGDKVYVDGGVVNPLPTDILRQRDDVDIVIGINVVPTHADLAYCPIPESSTTPQKVRSALTSLNQRLNVFAEGNAVDTLKQSLHASQLRLCQLAKRDADLVIHPVACDTSWYDFENYVRYVDLGRETTTEKLPELRSIIDSFRLKKSPDSL